MRKKVDFTNMLTNVITNGVISFTEEAVKAEMTSHWEGYAVKKETIEYKKSIKNLEKQAYLVEFVGIALLILGIQIAIAGSTTALPILFVATPLTYFGYNAHRFLKNTKTFLDNPAKILVTDALVKKYVREGLGSMEAEKASKNFMNSQFNEIITHLKKDTFLSDWWIDKCLKKIGLVTT
jgi:hypothetical protein